MDDVFTFDPRGIDDFTPNRNSRRGRENRAMMMQIEAQEAEVRAARAAVRAAQERLRQAAATLAAMRGASMGLQQMQLHRGLSSNLNQPKFS